MVKPLNSCWRTIIHYTCEVSGVAHGIVKSVLSETATSSRHCCDEPSPRQNAKDAFSDGLLISSHSCRWAASIKIERHKLYHVVICVLVSWPLPGFCRHRERKVTKPKIGASAETYLVYQTLSSGCVIIAVEAESPHDVVAET